MKKFLVLTTIILSVLLYKNTTFKTIEVEPDVELLLKQKVSAKTLEERIKDSLDKNRVDDAKSFMSLAKKLHLPISDALKKKIDEQDNIYHDIKEFGSGFLSGRSNSKSSLFGSLASDFTVFGDVRDLSVEGKKLYHNKEYDEFIFGLSAVGVALTVSEFFSAGTTAPLKVGTSLLKTAKKSGKLSKNFTKFISKRLSKTYDKRVFKRVDFSDVDSIKKAIKTIDLAPIKSPLKSINKIKKETSLGDTLSLLKYVDDEKDLKAVVKLSSKYKKDTKAIVKVLGKSALRATKRVFVFTYKWLVLAVMTAFGLVGIFIALLFKR